MTPFAALLRKDLRVELRTLRSLPAMALFAVTAFVIFRFGLDRTSLDGELAAGVLVPTLLFAALLAINRLFVAEREEGGFDLIRLAPVDRTVLFAAKASALVIYLVVLGAGSRADLRPLLPRLGVGSGPLRPRPPAGRHRPRRHRDIDLDDRDDVERARSAGAADPAAAAGPAGDRDGRGAASTCWPRAAPTTGASATWLGLLGLYDLIFLLVGYATFDFLLED